MRRGGGYAVSLAVGTVRLWDGHAESPAICSDLAVCVTVPSADTPLMCAVTVVVKLCVCGGGTLGAVRVRDVYERLNLNKI